MNNSDSVCGQSIEYEKEVARDEMNNSRVSGIHGIIHGILVCHADEFDLYPK